MRKLNVLIVEDDRGFSALLLTLARAQGHNVVSVLGARSVQPLVGVGRKGEDVPLDAGKFDLALCDYQLLPVPAGQTRYHGSHFVEVLAPAGVVCHGMSTVVSCNNELKEKGARTAYQKFFVLMALEDGLVSFEEMHADPESVRTKMDLFAAEQTRDIPALDSRLSRLCDETKALARDLDGERSAA